MKKIAIIASLVGGFLFPFFTQAFEIKSNIFNYGDRATKNIALTLDADMTELMLKKLNSGEVKSWYDQRVVDFLVVEKIPATFFVTGLWAQAYPKETKKISKNGLFEIGNHTLTHSAWEKPCFGLPIVRDKVLEVAKTEKILKQLIGYEPTLFRFPGGCASEQDIKFVTDLGLQPIGWDVSSGDAFNKNQGKIIKNVLHLIQPGSIVVFHLSGGKNAPVTAEVLPVVVKKLKALGYHFVTIGDLLKFSKNNHKNFSSLGETSGWVLNYK